MPLMTHGKKQTPPGQRVDVGGYRLHLCGSGGSIAKNNKGLPTVVIEAGCGWHSAMYYWLQKNLSQKLRVYTYDRAGLGWSEESHQPRDADTIATQLHTLLCRAKIDGPILLVGHSIAGLYLRAYAHKYPDNLFGMVLLDACHPEQNSVLPIKGITRLQRLHHKAMALYSSLGLSKIKEPVWELKSCQAEYLPESIQQQLVYLFGCRQTYITPLLESDAFDQSAQQALGITDLGDLPLVVVTALVADAYVSPPIWEKYIEVWLSLQCDLLNLSSRSQHKIIEGAGHCTLITKRQYAEQIAETILQLVSR